MPPGGQLGHTGAAFLEAASYHRRGPQRTAWDGPPLTGWEAERLHTLRARAHPAYYEGGGDEAGEAHRRGGERAEWLPLCEGTARLGRSYSGAADEDDGLGGAAADEWHARTRVAHEWQRAHQALREAEREPAERELLVFVCNQMQSRRMALPHLEREASDISTVIPAAIYQGGSPNLLREQLSLKTTRRFLFRHAHHHACTCTCTHAHAHVHMHS